VQLQYSNPGLVTYPFVLVTGVVGCEARKSLRNLITVAHDGNSRLTLRFNSDLDTYESVFNA
jgi:hypothetical protein